MKDSELMAARLTLEIAEQRWPNINRVTHPLLVSEISALRTKVWREESRRKQVATPPEK